MVLKKKKKNEFKLNLTVSQQKQIFTVIHLKQQRCTKSEKCANVYEQMHFHRHTVSVNNDAGLEPSQGTRGSPGNGDKQVLKKEWGEKRKLS